MIKLNWKPCKWCQAHINCQMLGPNYNDMWYNKLEDNQGKVTLYTFHFGHLLRTFDTHEEADKDVARRLQEKARDIFIMMGDR